MDTLKTEYINKLAKAVCVEDLIIEHLPPLIAKAKDPDLVGALSEHLEITRQQRDKISGVLAACGGEGVIKTFEPFRMLLASAGEEIDAVESPLVRDAVIIAAAQLVEHIEIGIYGTLVAWAGELRDSGKDALEEILDQEKEADATLSSIAEGGLFTRGVNDEAAKA